MKYLHFFIVLFCTQAGMAQKLELWNGASCDLCYNPGQEALIIERYNPLEARPIPENYLIFESRPETIKIKIKKDSGIDSIFGDANYSIGSEERNNKGYDLHFNDDGMDGDEVAGDRIFTAHDQLHLIYEEWIKTYKVMTVGLRLTVFKNGEAIQLSDVNHAVNLHYVQFNREFFETLENPPINILDDDGKVVHLGNSVYLDYESLYNQYADSDVEYHETPFDVAANIESYLNQVWGKQLFVDPEKGNKGLNSLNSGSFSISMTGLSGNTNYWRRKTGQTTMQVLLTTGTLNHELMHEYFGHFFNTFNNDYDTPLRGIGTHSHLPMLFTGQSGFTIRGPYASSAYAVLCPSDFENKEKLENGWRFYINSECSDQKLKSTAIDGIFKDIHSPLELFIMRLGSIDSIDFPIHVGYGATRTNVEESNDRIWTATNIIELSKDDIIELRELWYNRENGKYIEHYDYPVRNMLFFFNGAGKRTFEEYKMMHFISNELTKEKLQIEVPGYHQFGVNGYYDRYLSYQQATRGLGILTNEFPLPENFVPNSCDQKTYSILKELYLATDGDNWKNKDGWDVYETIPPNNCDFSGWYGIHVVNNVIREIDLSDNNLVGEIPESLYDLSSLETILLNNNEISGSISPNISRLENLRGIAINNNKLKDEIPREISKLQNLRFFHVLGNQLSGEIPPELGQIGSLISIILSSNELKGNIPSEFGDLGNLERLHVGNNLLSGCFAEELKMLCNKDIDIEGNEFHLTWEEFCSGNECISTNVKSKFTSENIKVFPNPTSNTLRFSTDKIDKIEIFSMEGKQILTSDFNNNLSLAHFKNGVYLLRIWREGKSITKRIIKI